MIEDGQWIEAGTEVVKDIFLPRPRIVTGDPSRTTILAGRSLCAPAASSGGRQQGALRYAMRAKWHHPGD